MNQINNISIYEKRYMRWKKWMELGAGTGCHQRPDRSFTFLDYQFPVCSRCTGVIVGYILALPLYFLYFKKHSKHKMVPPLAGCGIMLADWGLQAAGKKESTNLRRFLTGIAGGYGIMTLQMSLISKLYRLIRRKH